MKKVLGKYDRLFWDWNGTLINDIDLCVEIINQSLVNRSLKPVEKERYLEIFEFPVKNYYEKVGFDFKKETFETIGGEFIKAYKTRMFECSLHEKVTEALEELSSRKIPQFILSALESGSLKKVIKHYKLDEFFHDVKGLDDHYADGKVELGKRLMHEIGQDSKRTLMIGDTTHDFETASALGIDCVLVSSGHNSKKRLEKCGVPVFDSIAQLLQSNF
ncbi:MAG: HAD family hydrolase [Candidatus Riflebacteria bacterium]|nr:HAD family hydrolase [Candidatus Riflebacteria bacterium]